MNPNTVSSKCKFLQALPVSSEKADLSALLVEMTGMALSRSLHAACGLGRDDKGTLRSFCHFERSGFLSFRAEHASCHFEGSLPLVISSGARRAESRNLHIRPGWKQSLFPLKSSWKADGNSPDSRANHRADLQKVIYLIISKLTVLKSARRTLFHAIERIIF